MRSFSDRESTESLPGTAILERPDAEQFFAEYVQTRELLRPDAVRAGGRKELRYESDAQLWSDVIGKKRIFGTRRLFLEEFALLDWVPRAPGQYYTPEGVRARLAARNFIIERSDGFVVYDPYGKAEMVKGGVGCLRLAMKHVGGEKLKFLCATRSGSAHRGFIVALRSSTYAKVAELVEMEGAAVCNIVGEVCHWPTDESVPFHLPVGVPRIYLLAEDIAVVGSRTIRPGMLDATAVVTFQGEVDGQAGRYFTYAHFDPAVPESVDECVNWIRINYVEERYAGKVLTDFDEHISHFPDAAFPVRTLMKLDLSSDFISDVCINGFGIDPERVLAIFVQNLENLQVGRIAVTTVGNIQMDGHGNVVNIGDNNEIEVVTRVNEAFRGTDKEELGEAFALLRGQIEKLDTVPERARNRAARAVEDAEEEAAYEDPDSSMIEQSLTRAKEVLEAAGETYDSAKSWGKRLYDVGRALVKFIPAAGTWVAKLLG